MKKVSVIIPAFNCEKFINKCINSILEQTYKMDWKALQAPERKVRVYENMD